MRSHDLFPLPRQSNMRVPLPCKRKLHWRGCLDPQLGLLALSSKLHLHGILPKCQCMPRKPFSAAQMPECIVQLPSHCRQLGERSCVQPCPDASLGVNCCSMMSLCIQHNMRRVRNPRLPKLIGFSMTLTTLSPALAWLH